jgi:hypothetical protein
MKANEIKAFVNAYQNIMGYLDANDVEPIAIMLSEGVDEDEIYDKYFDATSVIDAYILWGAAKEFMKGEIKC